MQLTKQLLLFIIFSFTCLFAYNQVLDEQSKKANPCIFSYFSQLNRKLKGTYKSSVEKNETEITTNIDSANYEIVRVRKPDGRPVAFSIKNNDTEVAYWQLFHDNGKLKECGFTASYLTYIGQWQSFNRDGKFQNFVDYEKDSQTTFCDFYKLASKEGFTKGYFTFRMKTSKMKWVIENSTLARQLILENGIITKQPMQN